MQALHLQIGAATEERLPESPLFHFSFRFSKEIRFFTPNSRLKQRVTWVIGLGEVLDVREFPPPHLFHFYLFCFQAALRDFPINPNGKAAARKTEQASDQKKKRFDAKGNSPSFSAILESHPPWETGVEVLPPHPHSQKYIN